MSTRFSWVLGPGVNVWITASIDTIGVITFEVATGYSVIDLGNLGHLLQAHQKDIEAFARERLPMGAA